MKEQLSAVVPNIKHSKHMQKISSRIIRGKDSETHQQSSGELRRVRAKNAAKDSNRERNGGSRPGKKQHRAL